MAYTALTLYLFGVYQSEIIASTPNYTPSVKSVLASFFWPLIIFFMIIEDVYVFIRSFGRM